MTHPLEGILNIDKPGGMTSHDVVNRVRRVAGLRRIGHAGTLDPLATGVLLLCLGRATRLVEYLVGQPKTYETAVRLGQRTNTYDAEGEVVEERPCTFTPDDLAHALSHFRGTIQQAPPLYSAIKKNGQPLYKLARQGIEVEVEPRQVTIYELEVTAVNLPCLTLRITCSSGTYVRSVAHDLGQMLGCGGHVTGLRRTAVGSFSTATAVPLDHLTADNIHTYLLPTEMAVTHLPHITVTDQAAARLFQGQPVPLAGEPPAERARVYGPENDFLGLVTASEGNWLAHKMFPPL